MSAWTVISHTELGSDQASITLTSGGVWANYTDLVLFVSARSASSNAGGWDMPVTVNGSSANYSGRRLYGTGSSAGSDTSSTSSWSVPIPMPANNQTASTFGNACIYFPNINSSTAKSMSSDGVSENNATGAIQVIFAGLWNDTAAITSITLSGGGSDLRQYTSATLCGVLKGSSGGVTVS